MFDITVSPTIKKTNLQLQTLLHPTLVLYRCTNQFLSQPEVNHTNSYS